MKPQWATIGRWGLFFLLLAAPSIAETQREAEETSSPARDIDPEALVRKLTVAVQRDAADTVLRLLDGVDAEELGFSPLHKAARHGSARVAEALLDAGFDANVGVFKPLHTAAYEESPEVAALLIEHGAYVNASDFGWTPLHYALLVGRRTDRPGYPPGLRTANLLIERGADVNAATLVMGWTPLHLAAYLSDEVYWRRKGLGEYAAAVLELAQTLIDHGADVNARTRMGGWTPARVAAEQDEHRPRGSVSTKAVLAAIKAAGGRDEGCDGAPSVPYYIYGSGRMYGEGLPRRAGSPGCEYNLPFSVPFASSSGTRGVPGAFTASDADERLLFDGVGADGDELFKLVVLQDQRGDIHPVVGIDWRTEYRGLCLDGKTGTHTAVFSHNCDGRSCFSTSSYFHYAEAAGTLVEAYVGYAAIGEDGACSWREEKREKGLEGLAGKDVWDAGERLYYQRRQELAE